MSARWLAIVYYHTCALVTLVLSRRANHSCQPIIFNIRFLDWCLAQKRVCMHTQVPPLDLYYSLVMYCNVNILGAAGICGTRTRRVDCVHVYFHYPRNFTSIHWLLGFVFYGFFYLLLTEQLNKRGKTLSYPECLRYYEEFARKGLPWIPVFFLKRCRRHESWGKNLLSARRAREKLLRDKGMYQIHMCLVKKWFHAFFRGLASNGEKVSFR